MIIENILTAIYNLLDVLMVFEIPSLPEDVLMYIEEAFEYLIMGAGILANYTPLDYLLVLFFLLIAIDAGIMIYHFVMWIIRKIPMAGIS